jgi:HPt (histidine-containing phosphotransfer) domain-containing protein
LTVPGEPDVLDEVLRLFRDDVGGRLQRLDAAVEAGDFEGVKRIAHSIKGSAGNIGARALHIVCRQVEEAGRERNLDGVRSALSGVHAEIDRTLAAIEHLLTPPP